MTNPKAHVITLSDMSPSSSDSRSTTLTDTTPNLSLFHEVKTPVMVSVGTVVISIGELLNMQKGHVLRLDTRVNDPVDLLLEGKVVARGVLVAIEDHFGLKITEVSQHASAA